MLCIEEHKRLHNQSQPRTQALSSMLHEMRRGKSLGTRLNQSAKMKEVKDGSSHFAEVHMHPRTQGLFGT